MYDFSMDNKQSCLSSYFVEQHRNVNWSVICTTQSHMALAFAIVHNIKKLYKSSSCSVLDFCTFMFFYYLCPFLFSYYKKITLIIQQSWSRFDLRKGLTMGSLEMCICVLHDRVWSYRATLQG